MEASSPAWIQEVSIAAVAITSVIVAVWKYIKTEGTKTSTTKAATEAGSQIVAASFIESKILKELIDQMREAQEEGARIALRVTRSNSEVREATIENTEALRLQTDATLNMLRFIKQRGDNNGTG